MRGAAVLSRVAGAPDCTAVRKRTPSAENIVWQQYVVAAGYTENAQLRGCYSGCGRLSTAIAEREVSTLKHMKLIQKEDYRKEHDMSIKSVIEAETAAAERGEIIGAHFGIVCSS